MDLAVQENVNNFLAQRKKSFEKVLFKCYDCKTSLEMIVYNEVTHATIFLDDVSAQLFEKLAKGTLDELLEFFRDNELEWNDVIEFISELKVSGALNSADTQPSFENNPIEKNQISAYRDFCQTLYENGYLFHLHLDISNVCNLKCKHCYHDFSELKEMSYDYFCQKIDEAVSLGMFSLLISGGEPFLHPNFWDMLEYATLKGLMININTNATLIDNQTIQRLKHFSIQKIGVSLYSETSDVHNSITTVSGSFDKTLTAIKLLIEAGFLVQLKCVLMKENFKQYRGVMELSKLLKCQFLLDASITPKLNGNISPTNLSLEFEQLLELYQDPTTRYYADKVSGISSDDTPCNAGRYGIYYNFDEKCYPCVSLQIDLGTESLSDIWRNSEKLNAWRAVLNKDFSGYKKHSYCKHCDEICAGIALLTTNDYLDCENTVCMKAQAKERAFCILSKKKGGHSE